MKEEKVKKILDEWAKTKQMGWNLKNGKYVPAYYKSYDAYQDDENFDYDDFEDFAIFAIKKLRIGQD